MGFRELKGAPRELWMLYLAKTFESFGYFALSVNFAIFLSDETFGFTDIQAGVYYGIWGFLISFYGILTGPFVIDLLGVRKSMMIAGYLGAVARVAMALATERWHIYVAIFVLLPIAHSLGIPVMTIAVKRYSNAATRSAAFGVFYVAMNVAALIAGPLTDVLSSLRPGIEGLRLLLWVTVVSSLLEGLVATFMREIEVDESGAVKPFIVGIERRLRAQRRSTDDTGQPVDVVGRMARIKRSLAHIGHALRQKALWRLSLLTVLLLCVRLVFRHLDATFPKYVQRTLPGAPYGTLYAINPFSILVLVPLTTGVLASFDPFDCIVVGSFLAAGSVLWMAIDASVLTSILFVVTLSVGEAIYSPRVYEYTMLLAPKADEGLYTNLASIPMFVAKLFAGSISGLLLQTYCPEDPPRRCDILWFIVGCISLSSPVLMLLTRKIIHTDEVRRQLAEKGTLDDDDDDDDDDNDAALLLNDDALQDSVVLDDNTLLRKRGNSE